VTAGAQVLGDVPSGARCWPLPISFGRAPCGAPAVDGNRDVAPLLRSACEQRAPHRLGRGFGIVGVLSVM